MRSSRDGLLQPAVATMSPSKLSECRARYWALTLATASHVLPWLRPTYNVFTTAFGATRPLAVIFDPARIPLL